MSSVAVRHANRPIAGTAVRLDRIAFVVFLGAAAWHGGQAAWIEAKAELAQWLMLRAWHASLSGDGAARPWPWADTHPIARLTVTRLGVEQLVLDGASGRTLAFGPGHLAGTAIPGSPGNAVVSGHRDTHFAFLRELRMGDRIAIEGRDGRAQHYTVEIARVVDRADLGIAADTADTRLTLVTCYPFGALRPGGPLRYVVVARPEEIGRRASAALQKATSAPAPR